MLNNSDALALLHNGGKVISTAGNIIYSYSKQGHLVEFINGVWKSSENFHLKTEFLDYSDEWQKPGKTWLYKIRNNNGVITLDISGKDYYLNPHFIDKLSDLETIFKNLINNNHFLEVVE